MSSTPIEGTPTTSLLRPPPVTRVRGTSYNDRLKQPDRVYKMPLWHFVYMLKDYFDNTGTCFLAEFSEKTITTLITCETHCWRLDCKGHGIGSGWLWLAVIGSDWLWLAQGKRANSLQKLPPVGVISFINTSGRKSCLAHCKNSILVWFTNWH